MTPHEGLVIVRFLLDASLSLLWGGGGMILLSHPSIRPLLAVKMRLPLLTGSGLAAFAALSALPVQTAEIASSWQAGLQFDLVKTVALDTGVGLSLAAEAAATLGLVGAAVARRPGLTVIFAGLSLCTAATRGHAVAATGLARVLQMLVDALHVLGATAWIGALIPFVLLVHMLRGPDHREAIVVSLWRFSTVGHVVVGGVLLSGVANALLILGHLPSDPNAVYQFRLLAKIGVAVIMTLLALANRYVLVPMGRYRPETSNTLLIAGACCEVILGLAALALVAAFGLDDPSA
jgi:putative copper resistance protein D